MITWQSFREQLSYNVANMSNQEKMPAEKRLRDEDVEAALDLARKDEILMNDEDTRYIIEHDGVTRFGERIKDIGNFLHAQRERLVRERRDQPASVKTLKEAMAVDSKTWQEKESHE